LVHGSKFQITSLIGVKLFLGRVKYVLFDSLLRVPWISFFITSVRFFFIKYVLRRKLQMWSVDNEKTVDYDYSKSAYSKILIRPLTRSVIPISLASSLLWPEPFDKKYWLSVLDTNPTIFLPADTDLQNPIFH